MQRQDGAPARARRCSPSMPKKKKHARNDPRTIAKRKKAADRRERCASRQAEKAAACMAACKAVEAETPTLAASVQWAAPQIAPVDVAPSELHREILDLCNAALGPIEDTRVKA